MHTKFQSGSLKGTNHLEGLDLARIIILKWRLKKGNVMMYTEFIRLAMESNGGLERRR